jgi:hypothetical protein
MGLCKNHCLRRRIETNKLQEYFCNKEFTG